MSHHHFWGLFILQVFCPVEFHHDLPVPLLVEWGMDYEVFPDDQAEEVKRLKKARRKVQATFRQMPSEMTFDPELRQLCSRLRAKDERSWDEISDALKTNLCQGIQMHWCELHAVELVLEEANEELMGKMPWGHGSASVSTMQNTGCKRSAMGLKSLASPLSFLSPMKSTHN